MKRLMIGVIAILLTSPLIAQDRWSEFRQRIFNDCGRDDVQCVGAVLVDAIRYSSNDPGNGDDDDHNHPGETKSYTIEAPRIEGGKTFLLPLYHLGDIQRLSLKATGSNFIVSDFILFDMDGNANPNDRLGDYDRYVAPGRDRTWRASPQKRYSSVAIRAEATEASGTLKLIVNYDRPITFPRCEDRRGHEVGGGCYNSSACYLPGGGCYNGSACYAPGGGCYNGSACYAPQGGCYNSSACYLPGGGCYNGSACYPPGGRCSNGSTCYDKNGQRINPEAGKLVVDPGLFKYTNCRFNPE